MQGHGRLAGAQAALHDQDPWEAERMIRSCSAWMVATMSVMRPVRLAVRAASGAASPLKTSRSAALSPSRSSTSSSMPRTARPRVRRCRRRTTPSGAAQVAR